MWPYKKFHLHCGNLYVKNYLNIDFWPQLTPGQTYSAPNGITGTHLLNHDLAKGIPAKNHSLEVIYHSCFPGHLSYEEAWPFLRECHRVLIKGGVQRIITRDFARWIAAYSADHTILFDTYRSISLENDKALYATKGSVLMGLMHKSGQKNGWDYDTLEYILKDIGFSSIRRMNPKESVVPELTEVENFDAFKNFETLCVECVK